MNKSVGKSAAWLTATKFINLIFVMANSMLLSRFRTLEEYGTYSQLIMVTTLMTTIFIMGLSGSINYFLANANDKKEQNEFLCNYYTVATMLSLITGGVLVIISPYLAKYFHNPLIMSFLYVLALLPWINIITGSVDNVFIAYNKIKILSIFRIVNSMSTLVILIFTVLLKWNFYQYMCIFIGIQIIFTIAVYSIIGYISEKLKPQFNISLIKKILTFSIPLGLASVVGTLHIQIDQLMIGSMYNTETLAIYANASREMPVTIIASSITAVLMPKLVVFFKNNEYKEAVELWKNSVILSYIIICYFVTMIFVFAPQIISILYSDKYLPGVSIFRIFTILLLLKVTYFGIILNSLGKTKFIMYSSILALVMNVILNFLFFLIFGVIGAALATFTSTFVVLLMQLYYSAKETRISFKNILPWNDILIITIKNATIGILAMIISQMLDKYINVYISMVLTSCMVSILYILIMQGKIVEHWKSLS